MVLLPQIYSPLFNSLKDFQGEETREESKLQANMSNWNQNGFLLSFSLSLRHLICLSVSLYLFLLPPSLWGSDSAEGRMRRGDEAASDHRAEQLHPLAAETPPHAKNHQRWHKHTDSGSVRRSVWSLTLQQHWLQFNCFHFLPLYTFTSQHKGKYCTCSYFVLCSCMILSSGKTTYMQLNNKYKHIVYWLTPLWYIYKWTLNKN